MTNHNLEQRILSALGDKELTILQIYDAIYPERRGSYDSVIQRLSSMVLEKKLIRPSRGKYRINGEAA